MVCPWMENGNLNKYLERHSSSLSLSKRLCIVSPPQSYLLYNLLADILSSSCEKSPKVYLIVSSATRLCLCANLVLTVHSCDIIHGDLTGSNILLDINGRSRICDFGMSTIMAEFQGTSYFTSSIGGAVRWAAPELYRVREEGSAPAITHACDIYSCGSVILQVRTHNIKLFFFHLVLYRCFRVNCHTTI